MEWIDFIVIAVIGLIVGGAVGYIIKAKKSGKKCIGCPSCTGCSACCSGSCGICTSACSRPASAQEDTKAE